MSTRNIKHCDFGSTTMSKNGQIRPNGVSIVFWNQGTSQVTLDNNIRLAPATLDITTGLYRGGEAYVFEHPKGFMNVHTFIVTFLERNPAAPNTALYNNLTVQWVINLEDDID